MPGLIPDGGWTTETLTRAIKQGVPFPFPDGVIPPPPSAPAPGLVSHLRKPLGRVRRSLRRWWRLRGGPSHPTTRLHLLVDIQPTQGPSAGRGIGRYTDNLLHGLAAVRPHWRIEAVSNAAQPNPQGNPPAGVPVHSFQPPAPTDTWGMPNDLAYADWLIGRGADAILLTDLLTPTVVVPEFRTRPPTVLSVLYDLIPLLYPPHYLTSPVYLPHYVRRLRQMLSGDGVLAISQSTADDWARLFGPDCPPAVNVAGAVDGQFRPMPEDRLAGWAQTLRDKFGVGGEFLLYVGGPDFRKNLIGAVRAFARLPSARRAAHTLVIACHLTDAERADVVAGARGAGVADRVVITGRVSDAELVALYHLARLFVFPSLYEGLGLPPLEAASCGCPVVCGDNSSLPEYAGPTARLADADNPTAFARAIDEALSEPRDRRRAERLEAAGRFTWTETAERAAVMIEQRVAARPGRRR